jgi:Phage integrase family
LGLLGLRVSEACSVNIEALSAERGHRTVTVLGKGSKLAVIPLPPRVARAVDQAAGERTEGPLLLTRAGGRMNRQAATRIVRRLAKRAGITKRISPHSLRYSFITAALDAGVPLRDVQIAARHADPRTTTRYDRARNNLDRHASYIVTAFTPAPADHPRSPINPTRPVYRPGRAVAPNWRSSLDPERYGAAPDLVSGSQAPCCNRHLRSLIPRADAARERGPLRYGSPHTWHSPTAQPRTVSSSK